ncbi:MAG: hypothetical protein P4L31_03215 [Candidatus Babeliales bacterium]|nr:hypothetical protein [Candidatus Babeliales bacterium]
MSISSREREREGKPLDYEIKKHEHSCGCVIYTETNRLQSCKYHYDKKQHAQVVQKFAHKKKNAKSKYYGVKPKGNTWYACLTTNGKEIYLGSFESELEAGQVYNDYVNENGLKNKLNVIESDD